MIGWLMDLGTWGEWASGVGALAAIGYAVVTRRADHRREDLRLAKLERAEQRRDHLAALTDLEQDLSALLEREDFEEGSELVLKFSNEGPQPYYVTGCRIVRRTDRVEVAAIQCRWTLRSSKAIPAGRVGIRTGVGLKSDERANLFTFELDVHDTLGFEFVRAADGAYHIKLANAPESLGQRLPLRKRLAARLRGRFGASSSPSR